MFVLLCKAWGTVGLVAGVAGTKQQLAALLLYVVVSLLVSLPYVTESGASAETGSSGLKTPLRCSSVNWPWITS